MVANIEQQIQQRIPIGSNQAQVLSFVASQQWQYSGVKPAETGSMFEVWIPGIPSGVLYCDATGRLLVTFRFDRYGKLVSYTTNEVYGCV